MTTGIHEQLLRSVFRARVLAAQTAELVVLARDTVARSRSRVHAIRLSRELRAIGGSAAARVNVEGRRDRDLREAD